MNSNPYTVTSVILAVCTVFILLNPPNAHADKASRLNKQGIEQYGKGNAQESVQSFTDALVERPDSPELRFNRGTALSAAGNGKEAVSELERSAVSFTEPAPKAAAHFNAGNTLAVSGDAKAAIEQYRNAIMLDQSSTDFRKNLEMLLRQQQRQQQKQQQQQEGDQDQQKDQNDQNDQQQNNQQQNDQDQQQQQQQQQQSDQNKQQNQQPQENRPMNPEEAQRILDAMKDEEAKALELKRKMMQEAMKPGDDW